MATFDPSFLLFVPGDRPERFAKALRAGASGAILDLEDAVSADRKPAARAAVAAFLREAPEADNVVVRINGAASPWFEADLAALRETSVATVLVPKVEDPQTLDDVAGALGEIAAIALIESARGLLASPSVAAHRLCIALAFGPYDLCAELGGTPDWDSMLPYRAGVLVAARAHNKLAIDGPAVALREPGEVADEALRAARLGYDGKLLVHPDQVAPVRASFRPAAEDVVRAERIVHAARAAMPAELDGVMIDEPMLAAARRTLERAERRSP